MADPRILYDHQSQRWVACAIDGFGSARALLAISTSDSPTNLATGWTRYVLQIHREGTFSDFTTLGLDANGLYVTAVMRNGATNLGHTIMAIKKPEIYAGTLITNRLDIYSTNTLPVWTIQPAVNFDDVATNGYAWFVAKGPPDLSTNYQGGAICYRRLQWFGTNAAWAETNWVVLSNTVPSYRNYYDLDGTNLDVRPAPGSAVFAPQAGNLAAIDLQVVGSRLAMTVIRNGFLWTCQAIGLSGTNGDYTGDQSGAAVDRSAAQWLKLSLNVADGALSLHEHGRIYDSVSAHPYYYCFPSLMVNCIGDMVMGFSGTSAVTNISAFYIWRTVNGAKPDMPRLIRLGTTYFNPGYPWGDFSATTLDPTDDWAFWTVQEYADPAGDPDDIYPWRTVIARIKPAP
jgi:hypothetical protein